MHRPISDEALIEFDQLTSKLRPSDDGDPASRIDRQAREPRGPVTNLLLSPAPQFPHQGPNEADLDLIHRNR